MRRRFPSSWCRPMAVPVCPRAHLVALPSSAPKKRFETDISLSILFAQPTSSCFPRQKRTVVTVSQSPDETISARLLWGSKGPRKAERRQASNQLFLWSCPGRPSMAGLGMGSLERKDE
jgi:hypothetical protein